MTKRRSHSTTKRQHKTMRGGDVTSWFSGLSASVSEAVGNTKKSISNMAGQPATPATYVPPMPVVTGGRRRHLSKTRKGGFSPYTSVTNSAAHAASFKGGRTKRRKNRHLHSRHCKH